MTDVALGKTAAAQHAAGLVAHESSIGLGTGSTADLFIKALGERVRAGLKIVGVPTSESTARLARAHGIALTTLQDHPRLDLAIDGTDAMDPALNLVKGLGGALLREKIVACSAARFVVIATDEKLVRSLAEAPYVPVEVVQFGWTRTLTALEAVGAKTTLRTHRDNASEPFVTDEGHYILDCRFGEIRDVRALATEIKSIVGVVEHGFFIGMATEAILGDANGTARVITPR